jgi:hypothetical protein
MARAGKTSKTSEFSSVAARLVRRRLPKASGHGPLMVFVSDQTRR